MGVYAGEGMGGDAGWHEKGGLCKEWVMGGSGGLQDRMQDRTIQPTQ